MKPPEAPRLETRRTRDFSAELQERARAWIPAWEVTENEGDFGRALLEIAARFNSEVAERLDGAGEKMRRGFLDWLAVRREAARPSRMPVVFKLIDAAREPVLAEAPVRMQADAAGTPVVFETEKDVRLIPGRLETVIGADADQDAFYLPPPGISDLKPLEPMPSQWQVKSFASAGATKIQLDPELGLVPGMLIRANGQEYKLIAVDKDLVTIEPPLASDLTASIPLTKVSTFSPFDGARNWQAHVLYLGDSELLNIEAAATIEVVGSSRLRAGFTWEYWGKRAPNDAVGWQPLKVSETEIADGVALEKPKGAVEQIEIGGKNSRWIRARTSKVEPTTVPIATDRFSIRVNAAGCTDKLPCPADEPGESPAAEGMANTTPLVLDNVFFPLGKEPRQFDAFYLGSQEAFSKTGAEVQLCFEIADSNFAVLSVVHTGLFANQLLAGVAADGHLHLLLFDQVTQRLSVFANREPLAPPSPALGGAILGDPPITLDRRPTFRTPMWTKNDEIQMAVPAGNSVWIWHDNPLAPLQSGWESLGDVGPVVNEDAPIDGLVYLTDIAGDRLLALRDSTLFIRELDTPNAPWKPAATIDSGSNDIFLTKIAPIGIEGGDLGTGVFTEGFVGVGDDATLYGIRFSVDPQSGDLVGDCTELIPGVSTDVTPAAVRRAVDNRLVAVTVEDEGVLIPHVVGFLSDPGTFALDSTVSEELEWPDVLGESIDVNIVKGQLTFIFSAQIDDQSTGLTVWTPFDLIHPDTLFNTVIPPAIGIASGAPTLLPGHILVPTTSGQVIVAPFDPDLRFVFIAPLGSVVITQTQADQLTPGDFVGYRADKPGPVDFQLEEINDPGIQFRGLTFHPLTNALVEGEDLFVYKAATATFTGSIPDATHLDEILIDPGDFDTQSGSVLFIDTTGNPPELYEVDSFDSVTRIATLDRDVNINNPAQNFDYKLPDPSGANIRPMLMLDNTSGNWDPALLDNTNLQFEGAVPEFQPGLAFELHPNGRIKHVALSLPWITPPADFGVGVQFLVDAAVGAWIAYLGDTSSNPDLSWEYWNGTGWSKLHPVRDETLNFKRTGRVEFTVPDDLRSGDWAGKTNFWIRARLIGGDYGKEKVTVKTVDKGGGVTEQTIDRSLEGIRPPSVLRLQLAYAICTDVLPAFVLAQDSGTIRDQSDANRTPGAIVEAFIPLALTLGRLSKSVAVVDAPEECPPECSCGKQHTAQTQPGASTTTTPGDVSPATGRSLFIGLAATPSEAPINVLLLVDERKHTAFAPLKVEALIANSFQPIVVDDTTRALGESGLLSMSFPVSPTPSELFGKTLTWLRLIPKPNGTDEWLPALRGAYLNAVWASATETLTRELIGSSDGAPNLSFRLARPPVLRDTLELRVKEPLGEEEREALVKQDPNKVVKDANLPGDWVLWTQVVDPNDEPADARVYALDEATGEIRFGDGTHGRIPPIGRDAIVAFSYSRTETGDSGSATVPGNTITPRTSLNLVSPVETVEAVTSADQAAGGAPAELDERVLRFGFARLRHRNRAVTARDVEDLALQSSPDIVQARAVVRRGFIKLVIVMRGDDPQPTAAQVRELRRFLLEAAPAALSAPGALRIEGPKVRRLQIESELRIETLDHAGELGEFVKQQLKSLFDTASGGMDQTGWPLGLNPTEDDIAFALIEAPHLESLGNIKLRESVAEGEVRPWPQTVKETEIVMLADDPVRIDFETAEVLV
jgi:hypothetical protein